MSTTTNTEAVTLTAADVAALRDYLARTGGPDVDASYGAAMEMAGYLGGCLSRASGRPA